jgi:tRNA threonylcarbamoyladenosine biosynthesis protein TsaB
MLLGIDTCGSTGTIALARREDMQLAVLDEAELAGKTYSALLLPRIRELLEKHRIDLQQLEAIIIVNGPGSFTGVRVGLSAVKGLADALKLPVIAVSRLAVLAWKARLPHAVLDAGRGDFYFGDYTGDAHESLATPEEVRLAISVSKLAVCEEKSVLAFPEALLTEPPRATDALNVAMPRLVAADFNDIAVLDGNYLRRSDAELFARPKSTSESLAGKTQSA